MKTISELKNWEEAIGQVVQEDCLEFMKMMPDKCVDLVLTDPPYGIGYENKKSTGRKNYSHFGDIIGDEKTIDYSALIKELERLAKIVIVFGANCFPLHLPHEGRWICWDKRTNEKADKALGSPFELAWINKKTGYNKIYRVMHGGIINADAPKPGQIVPRFHPTQKPIKLFQKIIKDFTNESDLIFDPFMGSFTTAVAAESLERRWIGTEISPEYCKIGEERIRILRSQPKMF